MAKLVDEVDLLFGDRFAPITSSMGFLETDPEVASATFAHWQEEIKGSVGISVARRSVQGNLEQVLLSLLPLRMGDSSRMLLIPTSRSWTAFLDNGYRGTDPAAIGYLAERLNCRTLWVVAVPHTLKTFGTPRRGRQGALIMELYGPDYVEDLNLIREIRLQNNAGKWEFFLQGTALPFEETDRYSERRKTDRFTFDMLTRYLSEIGLHPFDEQFYSPEGSVEATLVELSCDLPTSSRDISLEEARRLNGIDD